MNKHLGATVALACFASVNLFADEVPAVIVKNAETTKHVKLVGSTSIKIDNQNGNLTFVVNNGEAEGTSISFGTYDFDSELPTAIKELSTNKEISAIEYYSLNGAKLSEPQRGINIVRVVYTDGSSDQLKTIKK